MTESLNFDVLIVGAGPAGLSAAIQLAQLSKQNNCSLSICVLEKAATIGAHSLSGAVLELSALNELIPDWNSRETPIQTKVSESEFYFASQNKMWPLPSLPIMRNKNNYIISLVKFCKWLGEEAERLGVHIFPGFAAAEMLYDSNDQVIGVKTGDFGLDKNRQPTSRFQSGIHIYSKQTLIAEGCRGSLSEDLIKRFNLRKKNQYQSYGIGVKELWKINPKKHRPGYVFHSVGWPLNSKTYGGSFVYHFDDHLVSLGLIIGLDYKNPYLDPFQELQRFKTHPHIHSFLQDGTCIGYGARALVEGGYQAIPDLSFPGGLLIGDSAGFLNVGKIKGIHNAMYSGMLAAQTIWDAIQKETFNTTQEFTQFTQLVLHSHIGKELHQVRNLRPSFHKGLWTGLLYSMIDQLLFKGNAPWTLNYKKPDHEQLKLAKDCKPIHYPKPDGKITFDKLTQVYLTGTQHREDEPCHLILKNPEVAISVNWEEYAAPEQYYCPASVYEIVKQNGQTRLQINAINCIHCKTCDIKDPTQNIVWTVPEGGDGPHYVSL